METGSEGLQWEWEQVLRVCSEIGNGFQDSAVGMGMGSKSLQQDGNGFAGGNRNGFQEPVTGVGMEMGSMRLQQEWEQVLRACSGKGNSFQDTAAEAGTGMASERLRWQRE
ncbi:hypothetical protein chiPu_0006575 [Chiloscyllium punctatum]|uniref:Uncharacterized protein n=1 Tax=Chiloscyllium punctatum TaxID=137246 RepID=A0A401SCK2_CHIPU|nr:hypothetical protein [Chiloscyllium punctatum]